MAAVPPTAPAPPPPVRPHEDREVTVVSHSNLFYWWPVWAVGFLMGILTWFDGHGHFLVVVPQNTVGYQSSQDDKSYPVAVPKGSDLLHNAEASTTTTTEANGAKKVEKNDFKDRDIIILPENYRVPKEAPTDFNRLHIARSPRYGVVWATFLLVVIVITNVPLRGLWSVVVIVTVILMSIIFALAGWWDIILTTLGWLDIRINAGGYFFVSGVLFAIWLISLLIFDRQIYMIFSPGQLKVCTQIGGGERVFDASGMKLEKQRSDLFRHWVLGLGSGDLIVRTSGAGMEHLELDNVLFIGRKTEQIERLMKTKAVEAK
jgi:hypothetical protein